MVLNSSYFISPPPNYIVDVTAFIADTIHLDVHHLDKAHLFIGLTDSIAHPLGLDGANHYWLAIAG